MRCADGRPSRVLIAGLLCLAALVLPATAVTAAPTPEATPSASSIPIPAGAGAVDTPELRTLRARAEKAKADLARATADFEAAQARLAASRTAATEAQRRARDARKRVEGMRVRVGEYAASVYTGEVNDELQAAMSMMSGDPDRLHGLGYVDHVRRDQNDTLDDMREAEAAAAELAAAAEKALRKADEQEKALAARAAEVQALSKQASAQLAQQLNAVNAAIVAAREEQQAAAEGAVARWRAYLSRLRAARITPPPAVALRNPARLPRGLAPVLDAEGVPTPGIAQVRDAAGLPLQVLSAETVRAVSRSFGALGYPYKTGEHGPGAFDCGGLISAVYPGLALTPAEQYAVLTPVEQDAAAPGDLVFLGDDRFGLFHVGVYLGADDLLSASKLSGEVAITPLPEDGILAIARPALAHRKPVPAPEAIDGMPTLECGAVDISSLSGSAAGGWGGYPNGLIPESAMCRLGAGSHMLRCDATAAFTALATQYARDLGAPICLTDSYRTYAAQVDVYARKPNLAAIPGNSNHGWGLAVDLCGGIQTFGTPQHLWMQANAPKYGWVHPTWAQAGGSRPEPWHWEYGVRGSSAAHTDQH